MVEPDDPQEAGSGDTTPPRAAPATSAMSVVYILLIMAGFYAMFAIFTWMNKMRNVTGKITMASLQKQVDDMKKHQQDETVPGEVKNNANGVVTTSLQEVII